MTQTRQRFGWLFVAANAPLVAALTGQFAFGLQPCELCLLERIPFAVVSLLSLVGLAVSLLPRGGNLLLTGRTEKLIFALSILALAGNAVLAGFHVGVEHHWWASPVCSSANAEAESLGSMSLADLQTALESPAPRPSCDVVQWSLFGLSLAAYNGLYCVLLVGGGLFLYRSIPTAPSAPTSLFERNQRK